MFQLKHVDLRTIIVIIGRDCTCAKEQLKSEFYDKLNIQNLHLRKYTCMLFSSSSVTEMLSFNLPLSNVIVRDLKKTR